MHLRCYAGMFHDSADAARHSNLCAGAAFSTCCTEQLVRTKRRYPILGFDLACARWRICTAKGCRQPPARANRCSTILCSDLALISHPCARPKQCMLQHRFARTGGCLQNMMLNKLPVGLAWLSARHVLQTAAGAIETKVGSSFLHPAYMSHQPARPKRRMIDDHFVRTGGCLQHAPSI